jgi:hypothetical protein
MMSSFNTQAVDQDVADVLDETYVPSTADDIALFAEKCRNLSTLFWKVKS